MDQSDEYPNRSHVSLLRVVYNWLNYLLHTNYDHPETPYRNGKRCIYVKNPPTPHTTHTTVTFGV